MHVMSSVVLLSYSGGLSDISVMLQTTNKRFSIPTTFMSTTETSIDAAYRLLKECTNIDKGTWIVLKLVGVHDLPSNEDANGDRFIHLIYTCLVPDHITNVMTTEKEIVWKPIFDLSKDNTIPEHLTIINYAGMHA
jgi:ADP-ribose pyrophosphatase YjhB (NUDIX family)